MTILRAVPKKKTPRCARYLAFVRTHPCCSCGTDQGIHAHHVASGGMGQKASDYMAAPLCGQCHSHWHSLAYLPGCGGFSTVKEEMLASKVTLWEAACRCLAEWTAGRL